MTAPVRAIIDGVPTQTCSDCAFYIAQECRRHAPVRGTGYTERAPLWPAVADYHWCGDFEFRIERTRNREPVHIGDLG